jgi:hypothetical protein
MSSRPAAWIPNRPEVWVAGVQEHNRVHERSNTDAVCELNNAAEA